MDNYRISQREGISYPNAPAYDQNVRQCTGSLRGSYNCSVEYVWVPRMAGEAGRLVSIVGTASDTSLSIVGGSSYAFTYGQSGLLEFKEERLTGSARFGATVTASMLYDAFGHLNEVRTFCSTLLQGYAAWIEKVARIELDSQGRLLHEVVTTVVTENPYIPVNVWCPPDTTAWTYDAGYMKTAGSTEYTAEADGWLTSRRRVSGTETIIDTYLVTRFGGSVAEEQFTQAEPRAFYGGSRPQRVRYAWDRLPSEPLFVPRALTGLNGADYLGIISSHHR